MSNLINFLILIFSGFLTFLFAKIYKIKFNIFNSNLSVPTGFGITLPIILILTNIISNFFNIGDVIFLNLFSILILGLIYFIDDIKELSPLIRLIIAGISGLIIVIPYLDNLSQYFNILFLAISSILILCLLTNVFNFYDGADLNLSTTIFLFGLSLLNYDQWINFGFSMIGYSIGFGLLNFRSKNIYLGDAGSFVFACITFLIIVSSNLDLKLFPIYTIYVLTLPIIDVIFVIFIRFKLNHNLLTRNYLHLYQIMEIEHKRFLYLLPQILHFSLAIFLNKIINNFDFISPTSNLLLICFIYSPIFYLINRRIFLDKSYFFGDGIKYE